jgi:tetratricopeptide (TPR) repeat protein
MATLGAVLALGINEASLVACEGTALLMLERPMEASSKFTSGLDLLRVVVSGAYQVEMEETASRNKEPLCIATKKAQLHEFIQAQVPGLADGRFYVFDYALLYAEDNGPSIDHGSAVIRCAAILFNLALCYHQRGNASKSEDALRSAIDLYRTCARLLLTTDAALECTSITLVAMAALNNEACLHYQLGFSHEYYHIQGEIARATKGARKAWSPSQRQLIHEFHVNFCITEFCAPAASTA